MAALFEPAVRPRAALGDLAAGPGVPLGQLAETFLAQLPA
jgi:hypothetical protein